MALCASSCRFTRDVGLRWDGPPGLQGETTLPSCNSHRHIAKAPPVKSCYSNTAGTSGLESTNIPGFTVVPEAPLRFPSHMHKRHSQASSTTLTMTELASNNRSTSGSKGNNKDWKKPNRKSKSTYKHIPHSEKPPHLVARRNARERRRVQAVNSAFLRLRRHVPYENKHKRLSKVKTLHIAIDYIQYLRGLIEEYDSRVAQQPQEHQQQHLATGEK